MKFVLFVFISCFVSCQIFCSNKLAQEKINQIIQTEQNDYFKPLYEYKTSFARSMRIKEGTPEKNFLVITLEEHFNHKDYLAKFCNDYYKYQALKNKTVALEIIQKFWEKEQITIILDFKTHYENLKKQIKVIESQFETFKINSSSKDESFYNTLIQELINEEIKPLNDEYNEAYQFDLKNIYEKEELLKENLNNVIDWNKSCHKICKNFIYKISGASSDNIGINFSQDILNHFEKINKKIVYNDKPNALLMQSFFHSIITNLPVFKGCVDYYNSLASQQYPIQIKEKIAGTLSTGALEYYKMKLEKKMNTEPDVYITTIQQNCMSVVSLAVEPIVESALKKRFSHAFNIEQTASLICTVLFNNKYEYENYPEMQEIITDLIEYISLPTNADTIDTLIKIARCKTPDAIKAYKKRIAQKRLSLIDKENSLEERLNQYQKQHKEFEQESALVKKQLLELSKETQAIKQERSTLEAQAQNLNNQKQDLKNQHMVLTALDKQLAEKETQLNKTKTELDQKNLDLIEKEKILNNQKQDLKNQHMVLTDLNKQLTEKETQLNKKKLDLIEQQTSLTERLDNLKEIESEIERKQQSLNTIFFRLKISLYVSVVATFLFIATLIQKKYQFIH